MDFKVSKSYSYGATLTKKVAPLKLLGLNHQNPFFLMTPLYHLALSFKMRFWVS